MKEENKKSGVMLKVLIFLVFSLLYALLTPCVFTGIEGAVPEHRLYILFAVLPFAAVLLIEWLVIKKTKVSPLLTAMASIPAAVVCLAVILIANRTSPLSLFGYSLTVICARLFILFLQSAAKKKKLCAAVALFCCPLIMYAAIYSISFDSTFQPFVFTPEEGTPDRTNSWDSINQIVLKDESWEKIVKNTPFTLGEGEKAVDELGDEYYKYTLDKYPNLDGSTVCVPLGVEFARQHLGLGAEDAKRFVNFSTTHYAYEFLIDGYNYGTMATYTETTDSMNEYYFGTCDLVLATEPSDEELEYAKEKGIELLKEPICYDAFVFITHKDNPVDNLTCDQIRDIYKGKITNWKQVGGKDEKIRAFQREKNSGSQTAMENLVMKGANMIDPKTITIVAGMGTLVEKVAEYENETASLGYTYRYYIDNLYKNDSIKTISVDGVAPTDENIRSGAYPFTTNYYGVYIKNNAEKTGEEFLKWILSDEGQSCVEQAGYITMK